MRTGWICLLLLVGCAATTPVEPAPPGPDAPTPAGVALAPDILLVPGRFVPGTQPDGNTVILRGPRGPVVIDTGRHPAHAAQVLQVLQVQAAAPAAIINTHWHLDHVGGNAALRQAFPRAPVLASHAVDQALAGFLAQYRAQLQTLLRDPGQAKAEDLAAWRAEIARIDDVASLRPTQAVEAAADMTLGGRALHLGVERDAVSGGDVWVLDRATRTLVAGDLVTLPAPLWDTACPAGWRIALERLDALEFDRLVPGHGAPMDRAGFTTYRRAFDRLLDCAASTAPAATCKAQWHADAGTLFAPSDAALADSLLDYYLDQVLRAPPARRDRYCTAGTAP